VAAFPVAKLGLLLIKQVSKPIAKRIAARARETRIFRDYVCIPTAQLFHWYEIQLKLKILNVGGKATKVPKLSEAKAIEQGSEILSEFLLFSLAASILIYEYNRSSEKEAAKEERLRADREMIKTKITELELKVERQTIQIKSLGQQALELHTDIHNHSIRRRLLEPKPQLPVALEEPAVEPRIKLPVEVEEVVAASTAVVGTNVDNSNATDNGEKVNTLLLSEADENKNKEELKSNKYTTPDSERNEIS